MKGRRRYLDAAVLARCTSQGCNVHFGHGPISLELKVKRHWEKYHR